MGIKYLWIDSEVNLYTPVRDEFFIELSKQSTFHNLKINDSINNSNIDLIYFINSFIKKNNIDFLLLDPWELLFEFYLTHLLIYLTCHVEQQVSLLHLNLYFFQ